MGFWENFYQSHGREHNCPPSALVILSKDANLLNLHKATHMLHARFRFPVPLPAPPSKIKTTDIWIYYWSAPEGVPFRDSQIRGPHLDDDLAPSPRGLLQILADGGQVLLQF